MCKEHGLRARYLFDNIDSTECRDPNSGFTEVSLEPFKTVKKPEAEVEAPLLQKPCGTPVSADTEVLPTPAPPKVSKSVKKRRSNRKKAKKALD